MRKAVPLEKDCFSCTGPILDFPYQDARTVRACCPGCASRIAKREDPELGGSWYRRMQTS